VAVLFCLNKINANILSGTF